MQSSVFPRLFEWPSHFWSIGPAIAQALFDGGLRQAQTQAARAAYDASVAQYRQTVLGGVVEVEDNLAALRILEDEASIQDEAVRAARESVELTLNQYKAGVVSFANVITVQTAAASNGAAISIAPAVVLSASPVVEAAEKYAATAGLP